MSDSPDQPQDTQKPLAAFDFMSPLLWKQWKQRFSRYMLVLGYAEKMDVEKIDILLYLLGDTAEELWNNFLPQPNSYAEALNGFENNLQPCRNIFERLKFNSRVQGAETVDSFITSLHTSADSCEYGALRNKLIRERIVVGMKDKKICEQLQLRPALSEEAVLIARQAEMQSQQSRLLEQGGARWGPSPRRDKAAGAPAEQPAAGGKFSGSHKIPNTSAPAKGAQCWFCGKGPHDRSRCPARSAKCFHYDKPGHWAVVCKASGASKVFTVQEEQVGVPEDRRCPWKVLIKIENFERKFNFLIDMGADVTCIPDSMVLVSYRDFVVLCKDRLKGRDGKDLRVLAVIRMWELPTTPKYLFYLIFKLRF
ncbi:hypothetical protein PR048_023688 [Dryococelus australis]|uniref:CCHC-type domain-containing protein n=1 Tax=Dryococelus australis TaxID=614101 RepID=A0ABQ9GUV2_9NEOP|nr:hypothetical protein PR048_023688 [Dryococelus australis]